MIVGIIGGVASGKSFVTRMLESLGAVSLDADRAGHAVLGENEVKQEIRIKWGDSVFHADGQVDRTAVASRVFAPPPEGPSNLAFLESLTHPRIGEKLRGEAIRLAEQGGSGVVVLDAAVLLKAGWDQFCDYLIFVDAPPRIRLQRAAARGWDEAELHRREAAQVPLDEKRRRADFVIDNSGDQQQAMRQIREFWTKLLAEKKG